MQAGHLDGTQGLTLPTAGWQLLSSASRIWKKMPPPSSPRSPSTGSAAPWLSHSPLQPGRLTCIKHGRQGAGALQADPPVRWPHAEGAAVAGRYTH